MNPTAEQIAALFDFPGIFEPALKGLFVAREIKAFTTQAVLTTGDGDADQDLIDQGYEIVDAQRDRPRVEIMFTPGAGKGQFRPLQITPDREVPVETSWGGQYKLDIITLPDIRVHRQFVTAVRFIMLTQIYTLNANVLSKHVLQRDVMDAGTSPAMNADKGAFQSVMLFDLDFSIQDDAWETITAQNPTPEPIQADPLVDTEGDNLVTVDGDRLVVY